MDLAKLLTNDIERNIRFYRVPVLTALGFSLRYFFEDRFLITDPRTEDVRRGIVNLEGISQVKRLATKGEMGVDSRFFLDMGGLLLFNGVPNEDGSQIVPIRSVTSTGGQEDPVDIIFTHTGDAQAKLEKIRRFNDRRPQEVNWRIRFPVMIAPQTSVIDYLAFRCSKLPFLHSIALKWGDRRWDPRRTPISEDLFRPEGEDSHMIIMAPVWMDETMTRLDPNIWGGYEPIVQWNYEEYLGRRDDEYREDIMSFLGNYAVWNNTIDSYKMCQYMGIDPNDEEEALTDEEKKIASTGRLQRRLSVTSNRTLHIPFDRNIRTSDYTYHSIAYSQGDGIDVTDDPFNFKEVDGSISYSSGFISEDLERDGWYHDGPGGISRIDASGDPDDEEWIKSLPPITTTLDEQDVYATHFMRLSAGTVARRMVLPDGEFLLDFWAKVPDHRDDIVYNVEVIRNTRLETKKVIIGQTSRIADVRQFRESYHTVARSRLPTTQDQWQHFTISFQLKDHFFIKNEAYPAHEVFIVLSIFKEGIVDEIGVPDSLPMSIGPFRLFVDQFSHNIQLVNTAARYRFANLLTEEQRIIRTEDVFRDDTPFAEIEKAVAQARFDGQNICAVVDHRLGYNVSQDGTTINTWLKVNSEEEEANRVLISRGSFNLFQKTGSNLPQYQAIVDGDRQVQFTFFTDIAGNLNVPITTGSRTYKNTLLSPAVGFLGFDRIPILWPEVANLPFDVWPDQTVYDNYRRCFREAGLQPREWISPATGSIASVPIDRPTEIGGGKTIRIQHNDPYIQWGGVSEMGDTSYFTSGTKIYPDGSDTIDEDRTHVTLWKYLEWHARNAYFQETNDVFSASNFGEYAGRMEEGFVFAPVAVNRFLVEPPKNYGHYLISPEAWEPRYSPDSSPGGLGEQIPWPIEPCQWGSEWPDPPTTEFGDVDNRFSPWTWSRSEVPTDPLWVTYPVFINGRIQFDRWFNWSIHMDQHSVKFYVNGLEAVEVIASPANPFTFNDNYPEKNTAELWIGTTSPDSILSCSPISVYSFKIYQRKLSDYEAMMMYGDESINFNDYQYTLYAEYLDIDKDRMLDFWQDRLYDPGMAQVAVKVPWSPQVDYPPFPTNLTKQYGRSDILRGDPITVPQIFDRDYNIIADFLDNAYIQELIEVQRNGFSDGLIFWDFYHENQEAVHGYPNRPYVECVGYVDGRLDYKPWLLDKISNEYLAIKAITDIIPYLDDLDQNVEQQDHVLTDGLRPRVEPSPASPASPASPSSPTSPGPSPYPGKSRWPTFGDDPDELLLSGVKGWFGFNDIMGYRDSLEKLQNEGMIFNYLQVEVRFRADRATLEAHLRDFAQDYDDIYFDNYEGNKLKPLIPR